jgi:hypothetical protein
MVGTDGVVLAGDRRVIQKHYHSGQYGDSGGVAVTSKTSKIKIDDDRRVAVAWARDNVAEIIAEDIAKTPEVVNDHGALRNLANALYRKVYPDVLSSPPSGGPSNIGEILIVTPSNPKTILYLEINERRCVTRAVEDKCFAGDTINPACYFVERFYDAKLSVDNLLLLAAHTILEAGEMSPMTIKGLEIVTYTKTGLNRFTQEQTDFVIARSKRLHSKIKRTFRE